MPIPDYYFDFTDGADGNNGTSEVTAWKTMSKFDTEIAAGTFSPGGIGKVVGFQCGELWRAQMNPHGSGSSGAPVIVTKYGSGNLPEIRASETVTSGWTNEGSNRWSATYAAGDPAYAYFINANGSVDRGFKVTLTTDIVSARQWTYVSGTLRIWVYSVGSPTFTFEGCSRYYCIDLEWSGGNTSYITFEFLKLQFARNQGLEIEARQQATTNIIIQDCEIANHGDTKWDGSTAGQGIQLLASSGDSPFNLSNITIRRCKVWSCVAHGIQTWQNAGKDFGFITVEQNDIFDCGHNNVDFNMNGASSTLHDVVFRYNRSYTTSALPTDPTEWDGASTRDPNGVFFQVTNSAPAMSNIDCIYNLLYDCWGPGLFVNPASAGIPIVIVGNVAYNCSWNSTLRQMRIGASTGVIVKNNISVDPHDGGPCVFFGSLTGLTIDNNCWFQTNGANQITNVNGVGYTTLAAWKAAANPQAQNDRSADPLFVDINSRNFALLSGSQCRNNGATLLSPYDIGIKPGSAWPSNVAFLTQGYAGGGFEIGAYVYPEFTLLPLTVFIQ